MAIIFEIDYGNFVTIIVSLMSFGSSVFVFIAYLMLFREIGHPRSKRNDFGIVSSKAIGILVQSHNYDMGLN